MAIRKTDCGEDAAARIFCAASSVEFSVITFSFGVVDVVAESQPIVSVSRQQAIRKHFIRITISVIFWCASFNRLKLEVEVHYVAAISAIETICWQRFNKKNRQNYHAHLETFHRLSPAIDKQHGIRGSRSSTADVFESK